jgi:hypothetical protein
MRNVETMSDERHATNEEMSGLLFVLQDMGTRLANETHGAAYDLVSNLNLQLHQVRETLLLIRDAQ